MRPRPGLRGRAYAAALDWLLIAAFLLGVAVPAVMTVSSPSSSSVKSEFRQPPPFPRVALEKKVLGAFPGGFDAWFKDVFWMRPKLIRWHNAIKLLGLHVSPNQVVDVGPNGWIFLADEPYVACTRGTDPFPPDELDAWVDALAAADAWCRERGIRFLFLIAPNKATVYPEEAPARYAQIGPTRLDQLYAALRERTEVEFVDLRPVLAEAKKTSRFELYYPLGTHWNGLGAAAAYAAIMRWIGVPPTPPAELRYDVLSGGDSWAPKLYLGDELTQRNPTVQSPLHDQIVHRTLEWIPATPGRPNQVVLGPVAEGPKVLFAHDSFAPWLTDLVGAHFPRSFWIWCRDVPIDVIEHVQPDVVVFEMVERLLHQRPPDPALHMLER